MHNGNGDTKSADVSNGTEHDKPTESEPTISTDLDTIVEQVSAAVTETVSSVTESAKEVIDKATEGAEAKAGEKRKTDEKADVSEDSGDKTDEVDLKDAKKQKTTKDTTVDSDGAKRGPGRPKGKTTQSGGKKDKKVPTVGKAERRTRSQAAI